VGKEGSPTRTALSLAGLEEGFVAEDYEWVLVDNPNYEGDVMAVSPAHSMPANVVFQDMMNRHRGVIVFSAEMFSRWLLRGTNYEGGDITYVDFDSSNETVRVLVRHPNCPETVEGAELVHIMPKMVEPVEFRTCMPIWCDGGGTRTYHK